MSRETAERAVREGDLQGALRDLQEQVRQHPANADLRVFLFQLLVVMGQWDRALTQLNVAAELDPGTLTMAQMYREVVPCERVRADVFGGRRSPLLLGEPEGWVACLIEALILAGRGEADQSEALRLRAFDEADVSAGSIDGRPFTWIADADSRLGPVLEAMINGRYYWVPFARISRIDIEPPQDLRDLVWMPAHLRFANGGESVALIPTRYPGSESRDHELALARKTEWEPVVAGCHHGVGQRIIATDAGEVPLMEIRSISIDQDEASAPNQSSASHG